MRVSRVLAGLTIGSLLVVACGSDGDGQADPSQTASPSSVESESDGPTQPVSEPASEDLPGERFDAGPSAGVELAVVGIAHDDVLELHVVPGFEADVVAELSSTERGLVATGHNRLLPDSGWFEVEGAANGWGHGVHLAELGLTDDITSQIDGGFDLTRETMLDLGMTVAEQRGLADGSSPITVTVVPSVGDLGEITLDVIGIGDDAVHGERLVVFGTPDEGGESFSLKSVERTLICRRGVADDGLCV